MKNSIATALCVISVLALVPGAAGAQSLFKCVQSNGRTVYQSEPCADDARQSTVRPPDPVAPRTETEIKAVEQRAKPPLLPMDVVIDIVSGYSICAGDADFATRHGAAYERWKQTNADAFARFQESDEASRKSVEIVTAERSKKPDPASRAALCARASAAFGPIAK